MRAQLEEAGIVPWQPNQNASTDTIDGSDGSDSCEEVSDDSEETWQQDFLLAVQNNDKSRVKSVLDEKPYLVNYRVPRPPGSYPLGVHQPPFVRAMNKMHLKMADIMLGYYEHLQLDTTIVEYLAREFWNYHRDQPDIPPGNSFRKITEHFSDRKRQAYRRRYLDVLEKLVHAEKKVCRSRCIATAMVKQHLLERKGLPEEVVLKIIAMSPVVPSLAFFNEKVASETEFDWIEDPILDLYHCKQDRSMLNVLNGLRDLDGRFRNIFDESERRNILDSQIEHCRINGFVTRPCEDPKDEKQPLFTGRVLEEEMERQEGEDTEDEEARIAVEIKRLHQHGGYSRLDGNIIHRPQRLIAWNPSYEAR